MSCSKDEENSIVQRGSRAAMHLLSCGFRSGQGILADRKFRSAYHHRRHRYFRFQALDQLHAVYHRADTAT